MAQGLRKFMEAPENERKVVSEIIDRTKGQIKFAYPDLQALFSFYNNHILPAWEKPEDINCGACRTKVIGRLRSFVTDSGDEH